MEAGESDTAATPELHEASGDAPLEDLLPGLPDALRGLGKTLIRAMGEKQQVEQAFSAFCSAAYVKPDWAGAASEFLAELFADDEDLLAEMTRIPDLIIELATGHITLTCMVASRWAARGETPRLARLAEALIATQSKMSGDAVVEVMLALATSLAITRYSRAEQLLAAAEPHANEEQQEALAEARQWLAAGRIVRSCSQEARDLWDQRLRRSGQTWTWVSREEREALLQLADHLPENPDGADLFKAVLPVCWWDLATLHVRQETAPQAAAPISGPLEPAASPATGPLIRPAAPGPEPDRDIPTAPRWNVMPFLGGITIGALSATAIFLISQPHRWPSKREQTAVAMAPATVSPPAAPPASQPAVQARRADDEWRKKEIQAMTADVPELAAIAARVKGGVWAENEALLEGQTSVAPRESANYQKLLRWLHLDPPADPDLRARIPGLLVQLRQDDVVLDLWKRLVYPGSPNGEDIRAAAKQQIHHNAEKHAWTDSQIHALEEIAGWSVAKAQ